MPESSSPLPQIVLYFAYTSRIGGGNRVMMELALGLDRARFAPRILAPSEGPLVDWAHERRVPVHVIRGGDAAGRIGLVRRAIPLAMHAAAHRVRIVHATAPSCYRAAGLAGSLLGAVRICHLGEPPGPADLAWSFRFGPDAVIACHRGQMAEVDAMVRAIRPGARVVAVPNSVDTDAFRPGEPSPRWRFGARRVVVTVGHLSEVKRLPTFLRAAAIVTRSLGDSAFVVVGGEVEDGYVARMRQLAAELGIADSVHFVGAQSAIADIFRSVDVAAFPYVREGFPLSVLEAMACGCPVVATPVGGLPDAISDGDTGFLIPPEDPEALAAAVVRLLEAPDLARQIAERARRRVEREFSRESLVAGVTALYDEQLLQPAR